jgi:hypothetical protein
MTFKPNQPPGTLPGKCLSARHLSRGGGVGETSRRRSQACRAAPPL